MDAAAKSEAAAALTTAEAAAGRRGDDAEEMPLLFMDGLPSGFQQSAQLAALATFMAGSADESEDEGDSDAGELQTAGKQQPAARRRRTRRQQGAPYARVVTSDGDSESKKKKSKQKKESDATKELQLYLSMFKV